MLFSSKKLLGLDIGTSSLKIAEIEERGKRLTLNRFSVLPIQYGITNSGDISDPPSLSSAISTIASMVKSKRKNVATGMWGTSVIVKKITMPLMDERLVQEQIKWEAEQYIPFDINEVSLEHVILKNRPSTGETMDVLLVAAKQEVIFRYIESVSGAGLKLSSLDVSAFALANCFTANYGNIAGAVAVIDIGAGVTNLVIVENGEVIFGRDLSVGGMNYTNDIHRTMGVSIDEAEALKISSSMNQAAPAELNTVISSSHENVLEELRNSFEFFAATAGNSVITRVYLTGGSSVTPGLAEGITRATALPVERFDVFNRIDINQRNIPSDFVEQIRSVSAVAIGLALRKVGDS